MQDIIKSFSNYNLQLLENLRLHLRADKTLIALYLNILEKICIEYENREKIPKYLVSDLIIARDNIESAIHYFKGEDLSEIIELNRQFNIFFERIFF